MAKKKMPSTHAHAIQEFLPLPLPSMVALVERLLSLMDEAMQGALASDDDRYVRVFGSKEGLVPQLQRLCAVLKDVQVLSLNMPKETKAEVEVRLDADEHALITYYLEALRAQQDIAAQTKNTE